MRNVQIEHSSTNRTGDMGCSQLKLRHPPSPLHRCCVASQIEAMQTYNKNNLMPPSVPM